MQANFGEAMVDAELAAKPGNVPIDEWISQMKRQWQADELRQRLLAEMERNCHLHASLLREGERSLMAEVWAWALGILLAASLVANVVLLWRS